MNAYQLPVSLNVGGIDRPIRSDFRAILDILKAYNDSDLEKDEKTEIMLRIIYKDYENIPLACMSEAIDKACDFIDCGQKDDGKRHPRLVDWEQDAPLIVPAVNVVAHTEIRALPYLHWWTFWGYFMEIGESVFSSIVRIRSKKAKGEKLDKGEEKYYQDNKQLIDLKPNISAEEQAVIENMMKWL